MLVCKKEYKLTLVGGFCCRGDVSNGKVVNNGHLSKLDTNIRQYTAHTHQLVVQHS